MMPITRFIHISRGSRGVVLAGTAIAALALVATAFGSTPSATGAPASTNSPSAPAACHRLSASLGRAEGAAGTTFQNIRVTNRSGHKCTVPGSPRVAYVNRHHIMIGWPAEKASNPRTVTLRPGHSTRFALGYPDPGNFSSIDCLAHKAHQLRIRMIADPTPSFLNFGHQVCTTKFGRSFVTSYGL